VLNQQRPPSNQWSPLSNQQSPPLNQEVWSHFMSRFSRFFSNEDTDPRACWLSLALIDLIFFCSFLSTFCLICLYLNLIYPYFQQKTFLLVLIL
jgi:hypothetical protein